MSWLLMDLPRKCANCEYYNCLTPAGYSCFRRVQVCYVSTIDAGENNRWCERKQGYFVKPIIRIFLLRFAAVYNQFTYNNSLLLYRVSIKYLTPN